MSDSKNLWAIEKNCPVFPTEKAIFLQGRPKFGPQTSWAGPHDQFLRNLAQKSRFFGPQKIAKMHAKTVRVVRKICTRAKFFQQKSQMRPEIGQKSGRDVPFLSPTSPVFQPGIAPYCKICVDKTQLLNHPRELGRLFRVSTRCWSVISKVPYHRELPAGFPPKLRRRFTD